MKRLCDEIAVCKQDPKLILSKNIFTTPFLFRFLRYVHSCGYGSEISRDSIDTSV